jgi:hypothetical protein
MTKAMLLVLAALLCAPVCGGQTHAAPPTCRCMPHDECWASVPFNELNASVHGRLQASRDELAACLATEGGDINSHECTVALNTTDDEFWLSAQPNGYQHTGLFNEWNVSGCVDQPKATQWSTDMVCSAVIALRAGLVGVGGVAPKRSECASERVSE